MKTPINDTNRIYECKDWKIESKKNRKEALKYRKALKELVGSIDKALAAIDIEMKKSSTMERGKRIAAICNFLDREKDGVRFFTLDEKLDLKKVREKLKNEA